MPTLLQINTVANWGSTGKIAEEIGITAIQEGWKSYIVYGRYSRNSKSNLIQIGTKWSIKFHGLQTRLLDNHGLASNRATEQLIAFIEELSPDIIHLHNIHGYYLNYKLLFSYLKTLKTPIVWTFHDCWPITGHCSHFTYAKCFKWKIQCSHCIEKREYPASILLDRSRRNYEDKKKSFTSIANLTLIPVSNWLESVLKESFLKEYPMLRIYNGVDEAVFFSSQNKFEIFQKYGIKAKFLAVGVASVWNRRKGLDDYIQLCNELSDEYLILLIGLTKKQIQLLPKGILGIERTENMQELAEIYSAADVVLNLSYEETFGLTTVEGMACGTPGIVYNSTASPELVTEETGLVVEPGNIKGVSAAIQQICSERSETFSVACRKRVMNCFRKEDRYQEYLHLYNHLLKGE